MIKIKTLEDARAVSDKIMAQLVNGKLTYFNILFGEEDNISPCFFSPVTQVSKGKSMIMVGDYEKILKLLLSHPKISDLQYNEKENMILAEFQSPYPMDNDENMEEEEKP